MNQFIKKTEPLHLQSYNIIKENIIKGVYSAGERITEAALARELGVSRGTVRESVKMLIKDGLIIQEASYLIIFNPTLEIAVDLYLCRERLESLAARLAAERISDEGNKTISNIIKQTEIAIIENDLYRMSKLNTEFHHTIITSSHNMELSKLMSNIIDKVAFIRNHLNRNNIRENEFLEEHKRIAKAIANQNKEEAEIAMSEHIKKDLDAVSLLYSNINHN